MKFRLGAFALLLAALFVDTSFAVDPSGTWRWEHQDRATQKMVKDVLKIKYENGKVSGTYQGGDDLHEIEEAKVEGNTLSWKFNVDIEGNTLNIAFTGEISGDDIKGTVTLGEFGEFPWTAKRDSAAAKGDAGAVDPSGTWRWEHQDADTQKTVKDVLKITYENGKVSGTYQGADDPVQIEQAKMDGNALSWEFNLDIEGNTLNIAFRGKITGDDVKGTVTLGGIGEFPWTAKRDASSAGSGPEPDAAGPKPEQPAVADLLRESNVPDVIAKSVEQWSNLPPHIRETVESLLQGELKKLEDAKKKK